VFTWFGVGLAGLHFSGDPFGFGTLLAPHRSGPPVRFFGSETMALFGSERKQKRKRTICCRVGMIAAMAMTTTMTLRQWAWWKVIVMTTMVITVGVSGDDNGMDGIGDDLCEIASGLH
jgi:hypothetical protein